MKGFLAAVALILPLTFLPGCREIEFDRLYALKLPGPPTTEDWERALPLKVFATGGHVHRVEKERSPQEVDQDTIHRVSASCHHGPSETVTFPVWLRAYHDDDRLYLRVSWPDLTMDSAGRVWTRRDDSWTVEGGGGDGLGIIWPVTSGGDFNCTMACHLDDFAVSGGMFRESARMRFASEGLADVWMWRAAGEEIRDLFLDREGIRPDDGTESIRSGNSVLEMRGNLPKERRALIFGPGDRPYADSRGKPLPEGYEAPPGMVLPAYLPLPEGGAKGNIVALKGYDNGVWEITISRELDTGDDRDIVFSPGGTYAFGLAVMDDTIRDHHVVDTVWELELLK